MIQAIRSMEMVSFARALLAGVLITSAAGAQDVEELEQRLRDSDDFKRKRAVEALADLGTPEAWELVIGALRDEDAIVADEAQIQLARVDDPGVLEDLLGKAGIDSRDRWVRVRVAEALGRFEMEVGGHDLVLQLNDKDAEVRRMLCWSLERLTDSGHLSSSGREELEERLERAAAKDKDPGVRAAALRTWRTIAFAWRREALEPYLADDEATVRAAAVSCADGFSESVRIEIGRAALSDDEPRVRAAAIELIASARTPEAMVALVDALEADSSERVRWSAVQSLQAASGLVHRTDVRPWRDWAEGLAASWQGSAMRPAPIEAAESTTSFAGVPLLSERVTFLVDLSGSMWEERGPDGDTRKQVVDAELRKALEALEETAQFNVIPYTREPLAWQKKLVPATKRNVQKALKSFEGLKAAGAGNFWDALTLALEDPAVDTIVVLTDGAPSGGQRWNLKLIETLFAERNRFRRVSLSAVLVDCPSSIQGYWDRMCADSGGQALVTDLR